MYQLRPAGGSSYRAGQSRPGQGQQSGRVNNITLTNPSPYQSASHSRHAPHARNRGGPERDAHTQHTRGADARGATEEKERRGGTG